MKCFLLLSREKGKLIIEVGKQGQGQRVNSNNKLLIMKI